MKKKKLIACILLLSIFSIFITSCSEQPKQPTEKTVLKVCIESSQLNDLKSIFNYYHQLYQDVIVQPILLPAGKEQRETEIKKIQTQIMAGTFADLYLLSTNNPFYQENLEPLFPNLNKMMYSGIFCDLNEFLKKDKEFNRQDFLQPILNAGKANGKQVIFPLQYRQNILEIEHSNLTEIQNTVYLSDLLELFQQNSYSGSQLIMQSYFSNEFASLLPELISYEQEKVLITKEELEKQYRTLLSFIQLENLPSIHTESKLLKSFNDCHNTINYLTTENNPDFVLRPLPTADSPSAAYITIYGAISAQSKYKQEAYQLLRIFFGEEAQRSDFTSSEDNFSSLSSFFTDWSVRTDISEQYRSVQYDNRTGMSDILNKVQSLLSEESKVSFFSNLDAAFNEIIENRYNQLFTTFPSDEEIQQDVDKMMRLLEQAAME